jgi:hypothetical protein
MGSKKFTAGPNTSIAECPKCKNNTEFVARSEQVMEDGCEIWIVCKCGYDPTAEKTGSRMEDVWGSLGKGEILCALDCTWNEPILEQFPIA